MQCAESLSLKTRRLKSRKPATFEITLPGLRGCMEQKPGPILHLCLRQTGVPRPQSGVDGSVPCYGRDVNYRIRRYRTIHWQMRNTWCEWINFWHFTRIHIFHECLQAWLRKTLWKFWKLPTSTMWRTFGTFVCIISVRDWLSWSCLILLSSETLLVWNGQCWSLSLQTSKTSIPVFMLRTFKYRMPLFKRLMDAVFSGMKRK